MSKKYFTFTILHTVDNDPAFSINIFIKAIVHVKFLLRDLSKLPTLYVRKPYTIKTG